MTPWPEGPLDPQLGTRDVHVWLASRVLQPAQLTACREILSDPECARAAQFARTELSDQYVAARGVLRKILSCYCACLPEAVALSSDEFGKLRLAANMRNDGLRFNLSHSGDWALYAIANGPEVGVDIEVMRERADLLSIADRFFSPREVEALRATPPSIQTEAFYACWTRKEAYVKAVGRGLSISLDQFDVSVDPEIENVTLRTRLEPEDPNRWTLLDISPCDGYAAALAVENPVANIAYYGLSN
jgi:4'-phosphopantetheinyl transferase